MVDDAEIDSRISCIHSYPICDMCLAIMAEAGDGEDYVEVMTLLEEYDKKNKDHLKDGDDSSR